MTNEYKWFDAIGGNPNAERLLNELFELMRDQPKEDWRIALYHHLTAHVVSREDLPPVEGCVKPSELAQIMTELHVEESKISDAQTDEYLRDYLLETPAEGRA